MQQTAPVTKSLKAGSSGFSEGTIGINDNRIQRKLNFIQQINLLASNLHILQALIALRNTQSNVAHFFPLKNCNPFN